MNRESNQALERRDVVAAMAIAFIAMIVRLLFLWMHGDHHSPGNVFYQGDAATWVQWATALGRNEPFEFDLPLRTPGVAYLLYWFSIGAPGPSFLAWKMAWCAMSAAACGIAYLAFRQQFARGVSTIAAGLCVLSFGLCVTATSLNNETPYMLVLVSIVWLTLRWRRSPSVWLAVIVAGLHGGAMLLRAEHMLALVFMCCWMAFAGRPTAIEARLALRVRLAHAIVVATGAAIVCIPWNVKGSTAIHRFNTQFQPLPRYELAFPQWTSEAHEFLDSLPAFARNDNFLFITDTALLERKQRVEAEYVRHFFESRFDYVPQPLPRFVLVSMKGPLDFAIANHPHNIEGGFSKVAMGGEHVDLKLARPDHLKLINEGYAVGLRSIASDFSGWLKVVSMKLRNFSDGVAVGLTLWNLPLGIAGVQRPVDLLAPPTDMLLAHIWRAITFGLLAIGFIIAIRKRVGGIWMIIIAYKLIVTILFYGYARQAVSILPAFYIFVALAIAWLGTATTSIAYRLKPR